MGSSSGASSGSSLIQNSASEEDNLLSVIDQRKRKRMISNRESARRSRMRKQKHLDDLTAQISHLTKENHQIVTSVSITTQHYLNIEAENSVLRAQINELSHRLESLNEIIKCLNETQNGAGCYGCSNPLAEPAGDDFMNQMNMFYLNQPVMASADVLQY